jgi:hypothetical protein
LFDEFTEENFMSTRQVSVFLVCAISLFGQSAPPVYRIFAGSTHAHTENTWSHGEQFAKSDCAGILVYAGKAWSDGYVKSQTGCFGMYVINGFQIPSPDMKVKADWQKVQGPPSTHFEKAKAAGYDFYTVTDHSQEAVFEQNGDVNAAWLSTRQQAAAASTAGFVAFAGFEYSENDGPGGQGHINVINSASMLNALLPGADLPYFYKWLETAKANGDGPVVATFNHPGPDQYNNWAYRTPAATDIITMLEVINSNNKIHYPAFVNALDHGWKVSPVCGNDNHGLTGIEKHTSRTYLLAKSRTKVDLLDAMKNRRTYASLQKGLECRYTLNGEVMGSTLKSPRTFQFDISVADSDTGNATHAITKIDIVKDHGEVAQEHTTTPGHSIHWTPTIEDTGSKYFFVRVWTAGGGDAPGGDPAKPVAWLAPVWTGR